MSAIVGMRSRRWICICVNVRISMRITCISTNMHEQRVGISRPDMNIRTHVLILAHTSKHAGDPCSLSADVVVTGDEFCQPGVPKCRHKFSKVSYSVFPSEFPVDTIV